MKHIVYKAKYNTVNIKITFPENIKRVQKNIFDYLFTSKVLKKITHVKYPLKVYILNISRLKDEYINNSSETYLRLLLANLDSNNMYVFNIKNLGNIKISNFSMYSYNNIPIYFETVQIYEGQELSKFYNWYPTSDYNIYSWILKNDSNKQVLAFQHTLGYIYLEYEIKEDICKVQFIMFGELYVPSDDISPPLSIKLWIADKNNNNKQQMEICGVGDWVNININLKYNAQELIYLYCGWSLNFG